MNTTEMNNWKQTFLKDDFNVDQSLSNYTQKADLQTLRIDLKHYCTELQSQMLEILKSETDAIVDLAVHLTKFNSKILNLLIPFSGFQQDIKNLCNLIETMQKDVTNELDKIQANKRSQNYIHLTFEIDKYIAYVEFILDTNDNDISSDLLLMERITNNFSLQYMHLQEQQNFGETDSMKHIETKLIDNLNKCFLNAFKEKNIEILIRCLKMYTSLEKEENAYDTFKQNIIQPELELFTEKYLESVNYDLEKVFEKIKHILDDKVDILTSITSNANDAITSFNFVLNAFWKSIDAKFTGLHYITAPGNPELFHQRYMATYKLLQYIAIKAGDANLIHSDQSFQNHLKRFNLPVYFEIRFQQIAGHFESEISKMSLDDVYVTEENRHNFRLKPSIVLLDSVERCLHKDVYIHQLADQFIRLVMLVLSRYIKFIEQLLLDGTKTKTTNYEEIDNFVLNSLVDLKIIKTLLLLNEEESANIEKSLLFSDVNTNILPVLGKILVENGKTINALQLQLQQHLTKSKISECNRQLINVTSIPRLYRRTNRNLPKEPSTYIIDAIKPIVTSHEKFHKILQEEPITEMIYTEIILSISKEYLTLVQEVLMSVCKTEESLKKFKSRSSTANIDASDDENKNLPVVISDEAKIREQIKLDIDYFYNMLCTLGMTDCKVALNTLKQEMYNK